MRVTALLECVLLKRGPKRSSMSYTDYQALYIMIALYGVLV